MIGKTLGPYEILEPLGKGGMGEVFRAHDPKLRRDVAIKVLPEELADDEDRLGRLRREARALASLNHPGVATVHGFEEHDGTCFIVMELVEGETLAERLGKGALPIPQAVEIALQIARTLEAAHERGIVHRDLKPANVKMTPSGEVKLLDFGVAKALPPKREGVGSELPTATRQATRRGAIIGTAAYMSPEQARGKQIDQRTDIWALGALLYEMLTGRKVFEGETASDILAAVLTKEPDWEALPDETPRRARDLLHQSLRKDLHRRLQHVGDARIELEAIDETLGSVDRRRPGYGLVERLPRRSVTIGIGALAVVAVVLAAVWEWNRWPSRPAESGVAPSRPVIDSLAILPVDNLTGDAGNEYLADGMTDELISAVGQIGALRKVISRTSVMRYKEQRPSLPEIGETLGVDSLVEVSLLEFTDRVRLSLRLYDAATEVPIWSSVYESEPDQVRSIYGEAALAIAAKIGATPTAEEKERLGVDRGLDRAAYEQYMLGRFYWNRRTQAALRRAIGHFERALQLDPEYADAFVGLADSYVLLPSYGDMTPREASLLARNAAEEALELDDSSGTAHAALAFTLTLFDWDWQRAGAEFRRAIDLNSNDATAHFHYAAYLGAMGRIDAAVGEALRAAELAPVTPIIKAGVAWMYHYARDYPEAAAWARRTLELDPDFAVGHMRLGVAYELMGRYDEGIEALKRAVSSDANPEWMADLAHAYAVSGHEGEARTILEELETLSKTRYVSAYAIAVVHAGLGERDAALARLEEACDERSFYVPFIRFEPYMDPLRTEDRFREVVRRMDFPD